MSIIKFVFWTITVVFVAGVVLGIYLGVQFTPAVVAPVAVVADGGWWSACPAPGG